MTAFVNLFCTIIQLLTYQHNDVFKPCIIDQHAVTVLITVYYHTTNATKCLVQVNSSRLLPLRVNPDQIKCFKAHSSITVFSFPTVKKTSYRFKTVEQCATHNNCNVICSLNAFGTVPSALNSKTTKLIRTKNPHEIARFRLTKTSRKKSLLNSCGRTSPIY